MGVFTLLFWNKLTGSYPNLEKRNVTLVSNHKEWLIRPFFVFDPLPPFLSLLCLSSFSICSFLLSLRPLSITAHNGAATTWPGFPWQRRRQLRAFPTFRGWRLGRQHGGVCPQLLPRWQDGRPLSQWRLCKSRIDRFMEHSLNVTSQSATFKPALSAPKAAQICWDPLVWMYL